jgi:putative ABC transport system substrate-binding protein
VQQGLRETGYVEPDGVRIEHRWAEGRYDRLQELAAELVRIPVAAILCSEGTPSALAAKAVTTTTPIIFLSGADPVEAGLVESLNRPGANVTGVMVLSKVLYAKQFELLDALLPRSAPLAMLVNPENTFIASNDLSAAQPIAERLGRSLLIAHAARESDFDTAIDEIARKRAGVVVSPESFLYSHADRLTALALSRGIPAVSQYREFAVAGGLLAYGPSVAEAYRQAGILAGKILAGARPADLPVIQMSKFELVLNLKTAAALGIDIPPSVLARADEVIE